jgi:hypothetical protein
VVTIIGSTSVIPGKPRQQAAPEPIIELTAL